MERFPVFLRAIACALLCAASFKAAPAPSPIEVFVNDEPVGLVSWRLESDVFVSDSARFASAADYDIELGPSVFNPTISGLNYGIAVTNEGPFERNFKFVFNLPIEPGIPDQALLRASLGGMIVNGDDGGFILTAITGSIQQVSLFPGNFGASVSLGTSFLSGMHVAGEEVPYGPFFARGSDGSTLVLGPIGGPWSGMRVVTEFSITPKDSMSVSGFVSAQPVPEPKTYFLMGTALAFVTVAVGLRGRTNRSRTCSKLA